MARLPASDNGSLPKLMLGSSCLLCDAHVGAPLSDTAT